VALGNFIIPNGHPDRPAAPHQHTQFSGPRDGCVKQVSLQHHIMGRHQRQYHHGELTALGLVYRDCVGQHQLVGLGEIVIDPPPVDLDRKYVLHQIDPGDEADIPIEDILIIIILNLHDLIPGAESGPEKAFLRRFGIGCI